MDRAEAVREMTFEEEAALYQQEAKTIFAKEDVGCEAPPINHTVRRGMRIIRKAREEIAALREQEPKWISVKERLPEYTKRVIVCDVRARNRYIGIWSLEKDPDDGSDCWEDNCGWWQSFEEVTHWMPLTELPEVEV